MRASRSPDRRHRRCSLDPGRFRAPLPFLFMCLGFGCGGQNGRTVEPPSPPPRAIEILGVVLEGPAGVVARDDGGSVSGGVAFVAGETIDLRVQIVTRDGWIDPRTADSTLLVTPIVSRSGIVEAGLAAEARSTILRLRALAADTVAIRVDFSRPDTLLYRTAWISVRIDQPGSGFEAFGEPDLPVLDLVVHQGRLVVLGSFTRIGGLEAVGPVAAWDGASWVAASYAFPPQTAPVVHLYSDGETLVAQTTEPGFLRWTGDGWDAPWPAPPPAMQGAVATLYEGDLVISGYRCGVLRLRDGGWVQLATPDLDGHALASHDGRLWFAGASHWGAMQFQTCFLRAWDGTGWSTIWEYGCSDLCSCNVDHLRSHGADLVLSWSAGSPGGDGWGIERVRGDAVERIGDRPAHASTVLDGWSYFIDLSHLFVRREGGFRELGSTRAGHIHDLEAFHGAIYVGGDFRTIGGADAPFLSRWRP